MIKSKKGISKNSVKPLKFMLFIHKQMYIYEKVTIIISWNINIALCLSLLCYSGSYLV